MWKFFLLVSCKISPVGWGCRIHQLQLCRGVRPLPSINFLYMTLKLWWRGSSLVDLGNAKYPFIAIDPRWSRVVASDKVLSMGQIEPTMCGKQMTDITLWPLYSNTWNHLCAKKSSDLFKNVICKMCLQIIYSIYNHKQDLALNNLQWLICHKTQPNYVKS